MWCEHEDFEYRMSELAYEVEMLPFGSFAEHMEYHALCVEALLGVSPSFRGDPIMPLLAHEKVFEHSGWLDGIEVVRHIFHEEGGVEGVEKWLSGKLFYGAGYAH